MNMDGLNVDNFAKLRRAKLNATVILLVAAATYFLSSLLPVSHFTSKLIQSAGEAGMVGGLADWFAITALFRRPLGLPIPHTALIPTRKNQIAKSLSKFVEERLIDVDYLLMMLRSEDRAKQAGNWLARKDTSSNIATSLAETIQQMTRKNGHLDLLDITIPVLRKMRSNLHGQVEDSIAKITGRLMPSIFDKLLSDRVGRELDRLLDNLETPGSKDRQDFDLWLKMKIIDIPEKWKKPLLKISEEIKSDSFLLSATNGRPPPRELVAALSQIVIQIGQYVSGSMDVRSTINKSLEEMLTNYVVPFGQQIGGYVEGVVSKWDAHQITSAIELQVGKDLQFIRINGTVIGAIIGILLFLTGALLGIR